MRCWTECACSGSIWAQTPDNGDATTHMPRPLTASHLAGRRVNAGPNRRCRAQQRLKLAWRRNRVPAQQRAGGEVAQRELRDCTEARKQRQRDVRLLQGWRSKFGCARLHEYISGCSDLSCLRLYSHPAAGQPPVPLGEWPGQRPPPSRAQACPTHLCSWPEASSPQPSGWPRAPAHNKHKMGGQQLGNESTPPHIRARRVETVRLP